MTKNSKTNVVEAEQAVETELVTVVEAVEQPTVAEVIDTRLNAIDAGKVAGVNQMVVKASARAQELKGIKTERGWRFEPADVQAWAEQRKAAKAATTTANGTTKAKRYTIRVTDEQLEQVKEALKPFGVELK